MTPDNKKQGLGDIASLYNRDAQPFATKAPELIWWTEMGRDSFDRNLQGLYHQKTKVLDLGSASARIGQHLEKNGILPQNITGIEISPDQVEIAKQRMPKATFICGDITNPELFPQNIDLVTSSMVFEFLDDKELLQALQNSYHALNHKGTLYFITTHPVKMKATSGLSKPGPFTVKFPWGGEGPNYYRTRQNFVDTVEKAGFKILNIEDLNLPDSAKDIDPEEYARYMQYQYTRLAIKATKS